VTVEVIIGFAVGYWVGTRQGRDGLARALEAAREVAASPEARKLLEDGLSMVQSVAPSAAGIVTGGGDGNGAVIRGVIDEFVERRFGRLSAAA
jgi:hypothetical protein